MRPLSSFLYAEWIEIRNGRAMAIKGTFSSRTLADINEVFAGYPDVKGHVCSQGNGRYRFSGGIPEPLRQRVRNVLACR